MRSGRDARDYGWCLSDDPRLHLPRGMLPQTHRSSRPALLADKAPRSHLSRFWNLGHGCVTHTCVG